MPIPHKARDSVVVGPVPEESRRCEVSEEIQEIGYNHIRSNRVFCTAQLNEIQEAGDRQQGTDDEKKKRKSGLVHRKVAELLNHWVLHVYIIPSLS